MFCSECGAKNEKNAKFCTGCGKELKKEEIKEEKPKEEAKTPKTPVTTLPTDQGGVRKAIKAEAKSKITGALIGATAIYLIAAGVLGGLSGSFDTSNEKVIAVYGITELLVCLLAIVFSLGITMVGFDAVRGKDYKWTDVFTKPFNHIDRLGYLLLLTIILAVVGGIAGVLMIIPLLGFLVFIAFIVALIYYIPTISIFTLMLADVEKNKTIDFVETIKKALELSKGNRVEFWGMVFSFIGWNLLAIVTCGILYIWLTPYMQLSIINMYRKWIKEEDVKITETGLSNGTVIGLTAGGCGCGCILVFIFFIGVIAAIITATGIGTDNPSIKSFIDKYIPAEDKTEIESSWNDIIDDFDYEYNR